MSDGPADCGHEHDPARPLPGRGSETLARAAEILSAAGDAARLALLERLAAGEACVTDLAFQTADGLSTVSQRLKILRQAGLVARQRVGKHVFYSLADAHVYALLQSVLDHAEEG